MRIKLKYIAAPLIAGAAAISIAAAPNALAADDQSCIHAGGATECVTTDNAEIYAKPQALPSASHSSYGPFTGYHHGHAS